MPSLIIPSIFTAIDKLTAPVRAMGRTISKDFAAKAQSGLAAVDNFSKKLIPGLGAASKQFLAFASTAAITAAIISGISFSVTALRDYETALASVQTITGLTNEAFQPFKSEIMAVAVATKESSIDVAKSFELIASANADLLKSPEQLGAVSKAVITLSQATGMSIAEAAGSLTNSMNQFGVGADKAQSFIDILVTSQAAGTATVKQLAESLTVAGGTAKAFGLDFDKTNALLQGFAKGGKVGAEAGTQLTGVLSKLSKVDNENFNPVKTDAIKVIDNLSKANLSYTQLMELTDAEGAKWLTTLINQNKIVQELAGNQNVASAAFKASVTQTDTLDIALKQLSNAWVNMLTGSKEGADGVNMAKDAIQLLTLHLSDVVYYTGLGVASFIAFKVAIIAAKVVMFAYNVAIGIYNAWFTRSLILTNANTVAQRAYAIASKIGVIWLNAVAAAQWLWNAAMSANPIALVIIAIFALGAAIAYIIYKWKEFGDYATIAIGVIMPPLALLILLVESFVRNWDKITSSFKDGGIVAGLKMIGMTILDTILFPLQKVLTVIGEITGADWASKLAADIGIFRAEGGLAIEKAAAPVTQPVASEKAAAPVTQPTASAASNSAGVNSKLANMPASAPAQSSVAAKIANNEIVDPGPLPGTEEDDTTDKKPGKGGGHGGKIVIEINDNTGNAKVVSNNSSVPVVLKSTSKRP